MTPRLDRLLAHVPEFDIKYEDFVVDPVAQQVLVNADVLVGDGFRHCPVVLGFTAPPGRGRGVKFQQRIGVILTQESTQAFQVIDGIDDEILVLDIEPLVPGQRLTPRLDRLLAHVPEFGGAIDVRRPEGRVQKLGTRVAPVAIDEDELGIGEVFKNLLDVEQVVGRLFAPAGLSFLLGVVPEHCRVGPGEVLFELERPVHDLVAEGFGVDVHTPKRHAQPIGHFVTEDAEILDLAQVSVGKEIRPEPRVVPSDLGHRDARMTPEDRHHQRRPRPFRADDENRPLIKG